MSTGYKMTALKCIYSKIYKNKKRIKTKEFAQARS